MKVAKAEPRKRGRPRGTLRKWYGENLPKMKPAKRVNVNVTKPVEVFVPQVGETVEVQIPKGWHPIPPELTENKTQASVGQTARNETKSLGIKDKRFVVHEIPTVLEDGKKTHEFILFAVEPTEE